MVKITKAVIPAAGLGTRFLPITKSIPKEMLPLLNTPAIQLIIEEGIASLIQQFFIITRNGKTALTDYFNLNAPIHKFLEKTNKLHGINPLLDLIKQAQFAYIMQDEPRGLGHAIACARQVIKDEFFGVFLPDDIFFTVDTPAMAQLKAYATRYQASIIGVQDVPREAISAYGSVAINTEIEPGLFPIFHVVEKPSPDKAPSTYAISGRYIFSPHIFDAIEATAPYAQGEIQLTDAINYLINSGHPVYAYVIDGTRFDIGTPEGWLHATLFFAQRNPALQSVIKQFTQNYT